MRRVVLRSLAILIFLGQLGQAAGGLFCGVRSHHRDHCDDMMMQTAASGPSVGASEHQASPGPCALLGPCSTPVPALAAAGSVTFPHVLAGGTSAGQQSAPASFAATPIPPPPQV